MQRLLSPFILSKYYPIAYNLFYCYNYYKLNTFPVTYNINDKTSNYK